MSSPLMLSVSGCRGVVGESLTPAVISSFSGAFGTWLLERAKGKPATVVIGRDGRAGGHMVRDAAVAGLVASGCNVVDLEVAMTPSVAATTDAYARGEGEPRPDFPPAGFYAGMVLTASHNPQQWNGLKCLLAEGGEFGSSACAPPPDVAAQIIERFKSGATSTQPWNKLGAIFTDKSASELHVNRVMDALADTGLSDLPSRIGHGLNVAVDCCNASGIEAAPLFLESLGVDEMLQIGVERDPSRGGVFPHPPEPTAENLSIPGGLCDAVRENECDVGFAQDPDADRLAIIDEKGRYIGEEYTLALSALALLEARRASDTAGDLVLVTNLSTSRMLDDVAGRYGARVLRTPVGEAHVVSAMKREAAAGRTVICGGEGNGGAIWPRVAYVRDSLSAMALVLWLISPAGGGRGTKRRISDLVASIPAYAIEKRKVDLLRREDSQPAIEKIARHYAAHQVDRSDGAWVNFTSGPLANKAWLHVRASNTEPIMRLIAEAPTSAQAKALLDEAAAAIR